MKTSFAKNYSKNYILLEDFPNYDYKNDFRIQMLSNNSISNTLDFSYTIIDNKPVFKYDITSKQSFSSLFLTNLITYKAYTNIILSLMDTIGLLEEYLIDINSLLIDENYIYLDPEKYTTSFIVCPALDFDFYAQLSTFLENILKRIDHSDDQLVLLAYRLSSEASKDSFNISMLKSIILSSGIYPKESSSCENIMPTTDSSKKFPMSSFSLMDKTPSSSSNNVLNNVPNIIRHDISFINSSDSSKLSDNNIPDNFNTSNQATDNSSIFSKLFVSLRNFNNKSKVIHNMSENSTTLYTISTSFYIKSVLLDGIFVLLLLSTIYCKVNNYISDKLSVFLLCLALIILIGSIKYLYTIFPAAKIQVKSQPFITENNISDEKIPENTPSTFMTTPDFPAESEEFGDTILLSRQSGTSTNHRLVYTGTDYVHNVPINSYPFTIGKLKTSADMIINNPLISRIHACIYYENNSFFIEDMNSSNGTFVNDTLLAPHEKFKISEGDKITFSHLTYIFE